MIIFGMSWTHFFLFLLNSFINFLNLFLVIVVWKGSPQSMERFKFFMLKMVILDLVFSITLGWLFQPLPLFPIPAAGVGGPFKYLGPIGGKLAFAAVLCAGVAALHSVNDCCAARAALIYGNETMFKKIRGWPGMTWIIFINTTCFIVIHVFTFAGTTDYNGMIAYAKRHGMEKYLVDVYPEMALIAYDIDNKLIIYHAIPTIGYLILIEVTNITLLIAVNRKLRQSRESMSTETYKMQKMLSLVLVLQAVIPFFSISIPYSSYITAFILKAQSVYESTVFTFFCAILFGAYPLVDCCLILFLMKPYRMYTRRLIGRIIPALAPQENIINLPPSGTSNTSNVPS